MTNKRKTPVYDAEYFEPKPRPVGMTATRIILALPIVAIVAAFIAALVFAGGVW